MIPLNVATENAFDVWDADGNPITGLVQANFTVYIYNPSRAEVSGSATWSITELGNGLYGFSLTPNLEGGWTGKIIHATYLPIGITISYQVDDSTFDTIEDKIDIIDTVVDAILEDTDTVEADLKTYMDTKETNIRGGTDTLNILSGQLDTITTETNKIQTVDDNVDLILEDTNEMQGKLPTNNIMGSAVKTNKDDEIDDIKTVTDNLPNSGALTTLITHLTDIKGAGWTNENLTTLDSLVDAILADTDTIEVDLKTYMDTKETNIRGGSDTLDSLSDQIDPLSTEANATTNTTTITTAISTSETNIRGSDSDTLKVISEQIDGIDVNTDEVESKLNEIITLTTRVLGLSQENFVMSDFVRDVAGRPTSLTITTYTDDTLTTTVATYLATTTYDSLTGYVTSNSVVMQ